MSNGYCPIRQNLPNNACMFCFELIHNDQIQLLCRCESKWHPNCFHKYLSMRPATIGAYRPGTETENGVPANELTILEPHQRHPCLRCRETIHMARHGSNETHQVEFTFGFYRNRTINRAEYDKRYAKWLNRFQVQEQYFE